jgi:hypothetical protein
VRNLRIDWNTQWLLASAKQGVAAREASPAARRNGDAMSTPTPSQVRRGGLLGLAAGLVGAAITLLTQFATPAVPAGQTGYPWVPAMFVLLGLLLTAVRIGFVALIAALSMSGVSGRGATARTGLVLALLGFAAQAIAQFLLLFATGSPANAPYPAAITLLMSIAPVLVAVGLILAGVGALRTKAWLNWRRLMPLAAGVVTAMLVATYFSSDIYNWGMTLWCCILAILGAALATQPRVYASRSSIPQR